MQGHPPLNVSDHSHPTIESGQRLRWEIQGWPGWEQLSGRAGVEVKLNWEIGKQGNEEKKKRDQGTEKKPGTESGNEKGRGGESDLCEVFINILKIGVATLKSFSCGFWSLTRGEFETADCYLLVARSGIKAASFAALSAL